MDDHLSKAWYRTSVNGTQYLLNDKHSVQEGQSCGATFPIYIDGKSIFHIQDDDGNDDVDD